MVKYNNKSLIGFFPLTFNLAETGRAILVAKRYIELGGNIIFFSHGGTYEHLISDFGFKFVRVNPIFTDELVKHIVSVNRLEKKGFPYSESFINEAVREEVRAFKKTNIKMIISYHNLISCISAKVAKIPLIFISPGPGKFYLDIPDNYKNLLTCFIPKKITIPLFNYIFNHSTAFLKPFNVVAKKYGIKKFQSTIEVVHGDINLATNFFEFINVFPNQQALPKKNYIGIILLEELFSDKFSKKDQNHIEKKILKFQNKNKKTILLTMGSSGDKKLFLKIINKLNKQNFKTIVVYTNILNQDELPKVEEKILFLKFVPSIKRLHRIVDLSIIHGGQGTVYSAAYSGKPIIGIAMNPEQHLNLEKMVGHKTGLMISKKYFNEKMLVKALNTIFSNYDYYLKNAQKLKNILPEPKGDSNAAKRLMEIIKEYQVQ